MNPTAANQQITDTVSDDTGRFGRFGGRFAPETLTRALDELADEYDPGAPAIVKTGPGEWIADGTLPAEELAAARDASVGPTCATT